MGLQNKKMQKKKNRQKWTEITTEYKYYYVNKEISYQNYKRQRQTSYTSKGKTGQNDITIKIIYATKNSASKYIKQQLVWRGDSCYIMSCLFSLNQYSQSFIYIISLLKSKILIIDASYLKFLSLVFVRFYFYSYFLQIMLLDFFSSKLLNYMEIPCTEKPGRLQSIAYVYHVTF